MDEIWSEEIMADSESEAVVAFAIHDGHNVREDVAEHLALSEADRLREQDPFTGRWTSAAPRRIVGLYSRFQVDLNRPRENAVYRTPDDAWGLQVWKQHLPEEVYERSIAEYDAFYGTMRARLSDMRDKFGRFVVLDLHSYNHRRGGPEAPPADHNDHPQVNLGTGTLDRSKWGKVADRFMHDLQRYEFPTGPLDVRENVKFRGGHFSRWVHTEFPDSACVLAVEFKKFFMDEWSGHPDDQLVDSIGQALRSTVAGILEELADLDD